MSLRKRSRTSEVFKRRLIVENDQGGFLCSFCGTNFSKNTGNSTLTRHFSGDQQHGKGCEKAREAGIELLAKKEERSQVLSNNN